MRYTRSIRKTKNLHFLPALLLCVSLLTWTAAHAQVTPIADTYTNTATPTTNYGAKTLLDVDGTSQITYIQFNLASIPEATTISQATLKLYVNAVTTAGSFNVDYVNSSWAESTLDASNAPTPGTTIASNVNVTTANKNQYILVNVTSAVQAWLSGTEANNGLALVANSTFNATFDSKENAGTSHPPELDIAFPGGTITGVTTASGSGLTGGGTSGVLNLGLTNACATNQVLQWNGSAWACAATGTGTITGVVPGIALTGGGTSGNVMLNVDTTQVPLFGGNNTFSGNNLFTPTAAVDAIDAYTAGPGKTAVVAIENATSGGSYGVWARTSDPAGAGVLGYNTAGGNAMVANGNASQSRTGGGWAKAMVYYDGQTGGGLSRCYNSTLTGAAATTPPCGFTVSTTSLGVSINFGFEVDDRFLAMNLQRCSCGSETPSWFATPTSTDVIGVDVIQAGTSNPIPAQWHLVVF